jgi:hypothetical protein
VVAQNIYGCGPQSVPILEPQMVLAFQKFQINESANSDSQSSDQISKQALFTHALGMPLNERKQRNQDS